MDKSHIQSLDLVVNACIAVAHMGFLSLSLFFFSFLFYTLNSFSLFNTFSFMFCAVADYALYSVSIVYTICNFFFVCNHPIDAFFFSFFFK